VRSGAPASGVPRGGAARTEWHVADRGGGPWRSPWRSAQLNPFPYYMAAGRLLLRNKVRTPLQRLQR
jgi:hypothetical protein